VGQAGVGDLPGQVNFKAHPWWPDLTTSHWKITGTEPIENTLAGRHPPHSQIYYEKPVTTFRPQNAVIMVTSFS